MERTPTILPPQTGTTVHYHNNPGLLSQGVAFHWWDAAFTSLHDHDYYEFFIITSGRTNHILNGACQELEEKTLCLILSQDRHQFTPLPGAQCIHINLAVTRQKLEQLCAAIGTSLPELLQVSRRQLRLPDADFAQFKQSAREINLLRENHAPERLVTMTVCQMLASAIVILEKQNTGIAPDAPQWLLQLLRRIHSPEYISCQALDVYRLAGYSPPVVIRCFRKYTGQTVVAYLTRAKMDSAKRLLASTELTVLDIAGRLGYSSVSHFNKLFYAAAGTSPRQYRRSHRADTTE